jgi:hypothetical protein
MASSSQQGQKRNRQEQEVDPSFTCTVCMEVLLDPVTPPCGHALDQMNLNNAPGTIQQSSPPAS